MELMADDTAELLRVADTRKATILGTSVGGRIAVALTIRHPELVKRLILVSTGMKQPVTWRRLVAAIVDFMDISGTSAS
jgi:pimeloyl-ACP methyl ester carboxylesterase